MNKVLLGMSCVGKTSYALRLGSQGYAVCHFDPLFRPYDTKIPGISPRKNLLAILGSCKPPFVLDNWTLEDVSGQLLYSVYPDACVCVLYDSYAEILRRYRTSPRGEDLQRSMFLKMYTTDFSLYRQVKYIHAHDGCYEETDRDRFLRVTSDLSPPRAMFDGGNWCWNVG